MTAGFSLYAGLKIRVVLWPQSTKTYAGPPDSAMWWSGGLLKKLSILTILIGTDICYAFISFSLNFMYGKDCSNAIQEKVNSVSCI